MGGPGEPRARAAGLDWFMTALAREILGLSHRAWLARASERGISSGKASEAYSRLFREGLPRDAVSEPARVLTTPSSEGDVHKFLLAAPGVERLGGATLYSESVVIPMIGRVRERRTLCVSSQVGCAMGCAFCETAQMGLVRSLTAAEIVAQWFAARFHLGHDISNIVFMGMGEPLDNLEEVLGAIEVLTDHRGPALAMSGISISTVGRLDGLARLREVVTRPGWRKLNLAVSINAPNDEIRSRLMPINRAMPLADLVRVLEDWPLRASGAICAEYVLIPGVNDADEHASELADLLKSVRCCINVIPYNPRRDSPWPAPEEEVVTRFIERLRALGAYVKRRRTKGRDTMAACGQLGAEEIRRRRLVEVGSGMVKTPRD